MVPGTRYWGYWGTWSVAEPAPGLVLQWYRGESRRPLSKGQTVCPVHGQPHARLQQPRIDQSLLIRVLVAVARSGGMPEEIQDRDGPDRRGYPPIPEDLDTYDVIAVCTSLAEVPQVLAKLFSSSSIQNMTS